MERGLDSGNSYLVTEGSPPHHLATSQPPVNPLSRYRRAQRRARRLFEPFTREHCAACPTPCCRKPARIRPVDLIVIEELGYSVSPATDAPADTARQLADTALHPSSFILQPSEGDPCDYLGAHGCRFPADLRPFGCVAFICDPMRRLLSPEALDEVEAAVVNLESAHAELMEALQAER